MKRLLFISLVLSLSVPAIAQETESEKPDDAFAIWTDYVVRKDIGKWHVGGVFEYASIDQGEGMKHNELMLRPVVGYNPLSWQYCSSAWLICDISQDGDLKSSIVHILLSCFSV